MTKGARPSGRSGNKKSGEPASPSGGSQGHDSDTAISEALSVSRGILAPLFNAVPEIIMVLECLDGEFRFVTANRAFLEFAGVQSGDVHSKSLSEVLPEPAASAIRDRLKEAASKKASIRYEQKIRNQDSVAVFDATVSPVMDSAGKCGHILWVARDVSPMMKAGEELRKKSAVLRLLHSASTAANRAKNIEEAARLILYEVCTYTGWPVGHLYRVIDDQGKLFATPVWHLEDPKRLAPLRRMTEIGNVDHSRGLAGWVRLSGKPQMIVDVSRNEHFQRAAVAGRLGLKGAYGFPILVGRKVVAVLEFMSRTEAQPDPSLMELMDLICDQLARVDERANTTYELEQTLKKIRTLSLSDDLTGISNRRGFITLSELQVKFAKRSGRKLILLFVDLDNMKQINDEYGHLQGDNALIDLARLLEETFRETDILARVGGDEFCVLLSATDADAGNSIARLDDSIERHNARSGRRYRLSISVGVGMFDPTNPCTIEELIDRADAAMYKVKMEKRELSESDKHL